jgi:hypothetical protein
MKKPKARRRAAPVNEKRLLTSPTLRADMMTIAGGYSRRFETSNASTTKGSRGYSYWAESGFSSQFKGALDGHKGFFRSITTAERYLTQNKLKGIEWGRWVTEDDRYNYVIGLANSLADLNEVTGFRQAGLGETLAIAFGSRGQGKALAHYEPEGEIINLTRYKRSSTNSPTRIIASGMNALAHEYGHALDYFFGSRHEQSEKFFSLTAGSRAALVVKPEKRDTMRAMMGHIIYGIQQTESYKKLYLLVKDGKLSSYWIRHNELFARVFEQYVAYDLKLRGKSNSLLSKTRYEAGLPYLSRAEFLSVAPDVNALLKMMAKVINAK